MSLAVSSREDDDAVLLRKVAALLWQRCIGGDVVGGIGVTVVLVLVGHGGGG